MSSAPPAVSSPADAPAPAVAHAAHAARSTRRSKRVRPGPLRVDVGGGRSGTLIDLSELGAAALAPKYLAWKWKQGATTDGKQIVKVIVVPGKLVNLVVR